MRLRRYLELLGPHTRTLVLATVVLAATAAAPGVGVALLASAVERLLAGDATGLWPWCVALVALYAAHAGGVVARTALTRGVARAVASELRLALHQRWLRASPSTAVGDRLAALTGEVDQVQYGVSAGVTALRNPLALAGLMAAAVWVAPQLTLWAGLLLVPAAIAGWIGGRSVRGAAAEARLARARLTGLLQEQLQALPTVQAFGAEAGEIELAAELDDADRRARLKLEVVRAVPAMAVQVLVAAALAVLLGVGASEVQRGTLQPSALVAFVVALGLANRPLSGLAEVWSLLQRSLAALERVDQALEEPDRVPEPREPQDLPSGPLELTWRGVGVVAGGRDILDEVDVTARPGEILALVGPTGAGKTTLIRLAWRALDPDRGQVTLGGVDLRRVRERERVGAVAVVPQDLVVLGRTVSENVALGTVVATDRVRRALALAGADFALELGLDKVLPEGGGSLSGGERQRLALARALVRDARVLLLDEPTSQVDPDTTARIAEALQALRPGRTIVVVAHDPALARHADRVVRLVDGRLVDEPARAATR